MARSWLLSRDVSPETDQTGGRSDLFSTRSVHTSVNVASTSARATAPAVMAWKEAAGPDKDLAGLLQKKFIHRAEQ